MFTCLLYNNKYVENSEQIYFRLILFHFEIK